MSASGREPPQRAPVAEDVALDAPVGNPRARDRRPLQAASMLVLGSWGLAALLLGLWLLPPQLALNAPRAIDAIFAQLPVTLPAATLVLGAAVINIGTTGLVARRLLPASRRSIATIVLGAYGGAVVLDVALLYVLGGLGIFNLPVLLVVHGSLLALALLGGRPLRRPVVGAIQPHLGWGLVIIVWSAPVLLQLASPVVPFLDVLPNLVAPVEHVRTFAHFDPLTTSPSPIYGPSRLSLGYVGLLGTVTTLSGLSAAEAISAFIAVEVGLVAIAVAALARATAGRSAVFWALIAFAMTQPFARLADDRSRILAIPIAVWVVIELLRASRRDAPSRQGAWTIGIGLGATLLMHAVIGTLLVLAVLVLVAVRPERHRSVALGLPVAGTLAVPQAAVLLGIPVPSLLAIISFPAAIGAAFAIGRLAVLRGAVTWAARAAVLLATAIVVLGVGSVAPAFVRWFSDFGPAVPFLGFTGLAGLIWVRPSARWVLLSMLGVGVLAGTLANVAFANPDALLLQSVRYEVPKEVHTWLPVVLAVSSAAGLAGVIRRFPPTGRLRPGWGLTVAAAWLVIAAVPLRAEPINGFHVGERHLSENLAIQLKYATTGYWTGYPDTRWLVDDRQRTVLAAIRGEIAAGRITASTRLLHVARTYQQWGAIPVGVFTGVLETDVSPDSAVTIHTVGGRLVPMDGLRAELADDYDYLLVEWRDLPAEVAQLIGGFEPIFTSEEAQLLRRRE